MGYPKWLEKIIDIFTYIGVIILILIVIYFGVAIDYTYKKNIIKDAIKETKK